MSDSTQPQLDAVKTLRKYAQFGGNICALEALDIAEELERLRRLESWITGLHDAQFSGLALSIKEQAQVEMNRRPVLPPSENHDG